MKIAIMSDFHFGYGAGTELEEDAYEAVQQAIEMSMECDLILMPGDLFDTRVPSTEALAKAMELMIKPSLSSSKAKFVKFIKKDGDGISPRNLSGIPIIAIHGTHERRTEEFLNPVQALEKAGFAIHLHCNGIAFEKDDERVAVFGLSGVPDQYAENVLREWNPKPEPGCFNIFMLHQNIREFMPSQIEHALNIDDLPEGFDLYLCGHLHEAREEKKDGKPFIFPGSLIPTQLNSESMNPRGFFIFDTKKCSADFIEIDEQRRVFVIEEDEKKMITKSIEKILSQKHAKKPLIRVKLPSGIDEVFETGLRHRYGDSALLSFKRDPAHEAEAAKTLEEHVVSVQELGRSLLEKNLKEFRLDPRIYESVFELISDDRLEEAEKLLLCREKPPKIEKKEEPEETLKDIFRETREESPKLVKKENRKSKGLFGFA